MNQLGPFLGLLAIAAVLLAGLGAAAGWWNHEARRLRRGLTRVLGEAPHALVLAPFRGRGAGFNFTKNTVAVAWDAGAWCLLYRIDELQGVELVVDGQVAARSYRGEPRRPLDVLGGAERQVILRLVFDDPRYPDFKLELWSAADEGRRGALTSGDAVEEANRWLARTESLFRRKPAPAAAVRPAPAPPPPHDLPFTADEEEQEGEPPWREEDEEGLER